MSRRRDLLRALLCSGSAFCAYLLTLAPSISWGDGPELTAAAWTGGVAHPTGYPLYTLLANGFLHALPLDSVAYRMNLLSALSAAAAVGALYLLLRRLRFRPRLAGAGALLFAFGRTFWSQAVIAEVYAFHVFWVTLVLLCAVTWERGGSRRWLLAAALAYGCAFAHHLQSALLAPGLMVYVLTSPRRSEFFRELRWTLPLFLLPLLTYAYLPLAALRDAPMNWNDPRNWDNFVRHVTGWEYRDLMFTKTGEQLRRDFFRYAGADGFLAREFGAFVVPLALVGIVSLFRTQRRILALTLVTYAVGVVYSLNYKIFDIEAYYLVPHLMIATWAVAGLRRLGVAVRALGRRKLPETRRPLGWAAAAVLAAVPGAVLARNWEVNDRHADLAPLRYARTALASLAPNALVLLEGDLPAFPLAYVRHVEGLRPDVTLVNMADLQYPHRLRLLKREGIVVRPPADYGEFEWDWRPNFLRRLVEDNIDHRPIFLVSDTRKSGALPWIHSLDRRFYRVSRSNFLTWEISRTPPPPEAGIRPLPRPLRFRDASGTAAALNGYECEPVERDGARWTRVRLRWRFPGGRPPAGAEVRLQLADAEGRVWEDRSGLDLPTARRLAEMPGPEPLKVKGEWSESFDLMAEPGASLWVAVQAGGDLLKPEGQEQRYVSLGPLPVADSRLANR